MSRKIPERDEEIDKDYIGNIWGWKNSYISLIFIVIMCLLMWWRYEYVKEHNPDKLKEPLEAYE